MLPLGAGDSATVSLAPHIIPDYDDPDGFTMLVGGVPSSYVHRSDPTRLEFEYMRWLGDALDEYAIPGLPVHTLHVGGAGCTMARYLAATRPRSRQVVLEVDPQVIALAREQFGYSRRSGFRLREADGLIGLQAASEASYQVIIRDAFVGRATPQHLQSQAYLAAVARALTPAGLYLANIADQPGLDLVKREVATAAMCFRHIALVGETAQLRGRRYGNVVLMASRQPLPLAGLTRRVARGPVPARVVDPRDAIALAAGSLPFP